MMFVASLLIAMISYISCIFKDEFRSTLKLMDYGILMQLFLYFHNKNGKFGISSIEDLAPFDADAYVEGLFAS